MKSQMVVLALVAAMGGASGVAAFDDSTFRCGLARIEVGDYGY